MGNNWFSFTNSGQIFTIHISFIEFYQGLVKIDTIIVRCQPFDFPNSYIKNREKGLPPNNDGFHIYGSYIVENKLSTKNKIQKIKSSLFPFNIKDLLKMVILKRNFSWAKLLDKTGV